MSKTASYGDVLALADKALSTPNGIQIVCSTPKEAINLRMNFYAKRAEFRDIGDTRYDDLTLIIKQTKTVVFRKKSATVLEIEAL